MELYEREYFIARIKAGYLRYKIAPGLVIRIYSPNMHEDYESREVYLEAYQESFLNGAFTFDEMVEELFDCGIWTIEEEDVLERLPKDVENFKLEMYNCYAAFDSQRIEKVRQYLRVAETEYVRLQTKKNATRSATCEGMAELAREHWLIENCTRYKDGKPYDWKEVSLTNAQMHLQQNSISETVTREIANSNPWRSIWATSKVIGSLFNAEAGLTMEQSSIIGWSKMYESIKESPDCPPDEVIDDNDLLDGFLLSESKKRDRERKQKTFDNQYGGKHSNADEVFIPVGTNVDDASRIQQMNDIRGRMVSKQRVAMAEEHGKTGGEVKYQNMPDVRMRLNQQANEQQKS